MPGVHRCVREMDTGSSSNAREGRGGRAAMQVECSLNQNVCTTITCILPKLSWALHFQRPTFPIPLPGTSLPTLMTSFSPSTQVTFTAIQMPQVLMVLFPKLQGSVSRLFLPGSIPWAGHWLWIFTLDVI